MATQANAEHEGKIVLKILPRFKHLSIRVITRRSAPSDIK